MTTHEKLAAEIADALIEDLTHRGEHYRIWRETAPETQEAMRQRWRDIIDEKLAAGRDA